MMTPWSDFRQGTRSEMWVRDVRANVWMDDGYVRIIRLSGIIRY